MKLKKVPGSNKGLSKLPSSVRNKMGYMKKGGKVDPKKKSGKVPKGEIDLGKTAASKYNLTLKEAEELADRVEKNYGRDESDVRTGIKGIDDRQDRIESNRRQARARAGNNYYDGDGGGSARRKKAYNDALSERVLLRMGKMKTGGTVKVKYKEGGTIDPDKKKKAAASQRESELQSVKENSKQMSRERALMAKVERQTKRMSKLGRTYDTNSLSMEEKSLWNQIQKNGMTKDIKK